MDLIAITTIHRAKKPGKDATTNAKAVPPEMEVIAPGESFTADAEEGEELVGMKAAREDKNAKKAPATTAKKAPATTAKKAPATTAKKQQDAKEVGSDGDGDGDGEDMV